MTSMVKSGTGDTPRTNWLTSALVGTFKRVLRIYGLGGRTIIAAPLILAIAIVPELIQHVVEIKLGMFASRDAFKGLANDPTRWAFGYVKLAGFFVAILMTARFWAVGGGLVRVLRVPPRSLARIAIGVALPILLSFAMKPLAGHNPALDAALTVVSLAIQTALLVYLVGALLEDREATLRWAFAGGWPRALFLTLLAALAFAPCQLLHMGDHRLALGQPAWAVWSLMLFDGLFVGLFAALVGSALFVGYRHGPSWRGWDRPLD